MSLSKSERRPKFILWSLKWPFRHVVSAWNLEQAKWKLKHKDQK